jgi:hypothetical protein
VVTPVEVAKGISEDKCEVALLEAAYEVALKGRLTLSIIASNRAKMLTKENFWIIPNIDTPS